MHKKCAEELEKLEKMLGKTFTQEERGFFEFAFLKGLAVGKDSDQLADAIKIAARRAEIMEQLKPMEEAEGKILSLRGELDELRLNCPHPNTYANGFSTVDDLKYDHLICPDCDMRWYQMQGSHFYPQIADMKKG